VTTKRHKPLSQMTLGELNEYSDDLESRKAELKDLLLKAAARRKELVGEDTAADWGLTPELYAHCKRTAAGSGAPLQKVLNRARAELGKQLLKAQRAEAGPVEVHKRAEGP
jgi:hypothetical protein